MAIVLSLNLLFALSHSSQGSLSKPLTTLVALLWTYSIPPCSYPFYCKWWCPEPNTVLDVRSNQSRIEYYCYFLGFGEYNFEDTL